MTEVVIAGAARTPVGAFNGGLASSLPAHELGKVAIAEALRRARVDAGRGLRGHPRPDPRRRRRPEPGAPGGGRRRHPLSRRRPTASTSSAARACAPWRSAIRRSASAIADIVVAGGQESMSQAPHCMHLRNGVKMGDAEMVDTMIKDGLWDAFNGYHMGNTAENVAQRWQITREQQDAFAAALAGTRPRRRRRPAASRTRSSRSRSPRRKGDDDRRHRRVSEARHHHRGAGEAAPGLRQERHGHRRQRLGHQ